MKTATKPTHPSVARLLTPEELAAYGRPLLAGFEDAEMGMRWLRDEEGWTQQLLPGTPAHERLNDSVTDLLAEFVERRAPEHIEIRHVNRPGAAAVARALWRAWDMAEERQAASAAEAPAVPQDRAAA